MDRDPQSCRIALTLYPSSKHPLAQPTPSPSDQLKPSVLREVELGLLMQEGGCEHMKTGLGPAPSPCAPRITCAGLPRSPAPAVGAFSPSAAGTWVQRQTLQMTKTAQQGTARATARHCWCPGPFAGPVPRDSPVLGPQLPAMPSMAKGTVLWIAMGWSPCWGQVTLRPPPQGAASSTL